jgi:hypothetical protein
MAAGRARPYGTALAPFRDAMTASKVPLFVVAGAALVAAGAGGYFLSEVRHGDVTAPAVEAVAQAESAAEPVDERPLEPVAPESEAPPAAAPRQEIPVQPAARNAEPQARPTPSPASSPVVDPARPQPEPVPVPAVTSAFPVAPAPIPVEGLATVPVPGYEPPVEQIALTVEEGSVLGVRLEEPVSSATAKVEDRVSAVVTREVVVDGRTAIPAGSRVEGYVTFVEPGGKFREKARIGIEFTTLVLPVEQRMPIDTEPVFREGESPAGEATSKIGASAVVGTVLGALIGGKKGAAIGGAAGAAGGTAVVAKGGRNDAVLAGGTALTLRLTQPVVVIVDR